MTKIIQLKAENFKAIKAAELNLDPTKPLVVVSGGNGQGKTSVVDAVWAALDAHAVKHAGLVNPIRAGADEAEVQLDLGDLVVTRRWKADGKATLEVVGKDGRKTPERLLLRAGFPQQFSRRASCNQN